MPRCAQGDYRQYFGSTKFSDVTILVSDGEIKAHKIILAHSEYFDTCFNDKFIESETNVVNLSQDNSRAIKGMLAYLYGIHFDTLEAFANTESSMRCDLDETELVLYQLDLYVVSTKYLMSDLSDRTRNVFQTLVHSGTDTDLSKLAVQVYLTYADEATELRKDVVDLFVGNIEECKDDRKFQDLLVNIPDLASDMVRALANANLRCRRKF